MGAHGSQAKDKNPNWRGGRIIDPRGYVLILVGVGHHLADVRGYAYEHRLEAEKKLGRRLKRREQVHHKKTRADNGHDDIDVKKNRWHHAVEHRRRDDLRAPGQRNPMVLCACGCGERFRRFDDTNRPRRFVSGHNKGKGGQWVK